MGVVALCTILSGWIIHRYRKKTSAWLTGLLFGAMCVAVMLVPVEMHAGFFVDCRVAVIGVAALIGGPVTGLTSLIFPALYRLYIGGDRVLFGLLELFFACAFGILVHLVLLRSRQKVSIGCALLSSLEVGFLTDVAMMCAFMPEIFHLGRPELGVPGMIVVLLAAPLSMALLVSVIMLEKRHFRAMDSMAETERRLLHSQKMAAIGELSNKIAHNILNSLAVILGYAEVAKNEKNISSVLTDCMEAIIQSANSMTRLTGELVAFASPGMFRFQKMELSTCLLGVENMLAKVIGSELEVVVKKDQSAGMVMMDLNRIEQVILHLAINAAEAMGGHGRLTIAVAPAHLSANAQLRLQAGENERDRHKGHFAVLSVQDTGRGMTPEMIERIFEPFFTTKENRGNAGLGLSTVYTIIQHHHGFIDVKSEIGCGSTFLIYFPVVAK